MGIRVIKGGFLLVTIIILWSMTSSIDGWGIITTPISYLGTHPATRQFFPYLITFQSLFFGAMYRRRNVKPFLAFLGVGSLVLISIYDMSSSNVLHNFFAIVFFVCQPIIFFSEYTSSKDSLAPTKGFILVMLILLLCLGILPLPLFEVLSYALLILFL